MGVSLLEAATCEQALSSLPPEMAVTWAEAGETTGHGTCAC